MKGAVGTFARMGQGERVLLLLGGNTGDPVGTLTRAEAAIAMRCGPVLARSRDHWTEPWGFADTRLFLNRALLMETRLAPEVLLQECLAIEGELGRIRVPGEGMTARPIDIDILLHGQLHIKAPMLHVPHPLLQERRFALAPAADIAPAFMHPVLRCTVLELLNNLSS